VECVHCKGEFVAIDSATNLPANPPQPVVAHGPHTPPPLHGGALPVVES
jgi:hypothetical protein